MRGKQAPKRKIKADAKYGSTVLAKFINYVMKDGKKSTAERVVYAAFDKIEVAIKANKIPADLATPLAVFDLAIKNVSPQLEVRGRRVGGANYQVPFPVRGERRFSLAFRWIIGAAHAKKGRPMADKLAAEFIAIANNEGDAIKKRNDIHRMAEANRAFAHFAR
jgi:small subunit ribosomal protein S7